MQIKKIISTKSEVRLVNWIHFVQFFLTAGVLGVGLYRMFGTTTTTRGSSSRWAVSVSAKSLIILAYQVASTHIEALKRFASLKAFMILNVLEHIFWMAAAGLTVMGVLRGCEGLSCTLSYVVIALSAILGVLSLPVAYISIRQFWYFKKFGLTPEDDIRHEDSGKYSPSDTSADQIMKQVA